MAIPKDISGVELTKVLKSLGDEVVRQKGSHIRIRTVHKGTHSETIPAHDPLKTGTLHKILAKIAAHFDITKEELV